jgi:hypothetical protein
VLTGVWSAFENSEVWFSPGDRMNCPTEKNCGIYGAEKANIWKCVNHKKDCYPIGDFAYNLSWHGYNESEPWSGVVARYEGGALNFTTNVRFLCHENHPAGDVEIDEILLEQSLAEQRIGNVNAFTVNVCPGPTPGPLTASASASQSRSPDPTPSLSRIPSGSRSKIPPRTATSIVTPSKSASSGSSNKKKVGLAVGLTFGILGIIATAAVIGFLLFRRKKKQDLLLSEYVNETMWT